MDRVQLTSRPVVRWNALPGAVKYDFWLDNFSTGQSQVVRTDVTGTSWTPSSDLTMGTWRAWVRGIDAKGNPAGWSALTEFQVLPGPTPVAPLNPTFDRRPTFIWNAVAGAVSYEVYVRNQNTGVLTFNGVPTSSTSWVPPADIDSGPYRWWVLAVSAPSVGSLRSGGATTVDIYIGGRTSILTPNGSTADTTPTFTWRPVDGAASYRLFVSRIDVAQAGIINLTGAISTTYTPTLALPKGTYRAWVRAVRSTGELSPWSVSVDFMIAQSVSPDSATTLQLSTAFPVATEIEELRLLREWFPVAHISTDDKGDYQIVETADEKEASEQTLFYHPPGGTAVHQHDQDALLAFWLDQLLSAGL